MTVVVLLMALLRDYFSREWGFKGVSRFNARTSAARSPVSRAESIILVHSRDGERRNQLALYSPHPSCPYCYFCCCAVYFYQRKKECLLATLMSGLFSPVVLLRDNIRMERLVI